MKKTSHTSPESALRWYNIMEVDAVIGASKIPFLTPKTSTRVKTTAINPSAPISPSRLLADKAENIDELKNMVMQFDGCALKDTATNTVFADGVSTSKIMLIGEAPGASEDEQGIPFCGQSGMLLDNMFSAINLSRKENIYISNTIFWRPPANRKPTNEEIEICRPFVEKHIALINPDLLVLVGATAVSALLGDHLQISRIRQEYYQYTNIYLKNAITTTAIFHPAYLLRQPFQKKATWYDLLKIQQFLKKR